MDAEPGLLGLVDGSGSNWFEGWGVCWRSLRLGPWTDDGWVEAVVSDFVRMSCEVQTLPLLPCGVTPPDIPIGIYRYLLIRIIRQVRFRRLCEWSYAGSAKVAQLCSDCVTDPDDNDCLEEPYIKAMSVLRLATKGTPDTDVHIVFCQHE